MQKQLVLFLVCLLTFKGFGQFSANMATKSNNTPTRFAETITAEDLRVLLTAIASKEFEGRETGTEGQRKAADFIANKFKSFGLPAIGEGGSYFQKIIFTAESWQKVGLKVGAEEYRHLWDYYTFPTRNDNRAEINFKDVVFLGFGIEDDKYNDYANANVKGKAILIYAGEPMDGNGNSLITGSKQVSDWSSDWKKKLIAAKAKGVDFVFIIDPDIKKNIEDNRRFLLSSRMRTGDSENPSGLMPNSMYISSTVAKAIVGKSFKKVIKARDKSIKSGKLKVITVPTNIVVNNEKNVNQLVGSNVLGYIEGMDPKLKDEVVVVTAHYDHLGIRGESIFYGADDNGSGTSTVIEVCQALMEAKKQNAGPRRSVLVMLVSGEEKGLLGSQYYAENPVFPLANTVANVNVDMVGRIDDKYKDNPYYIYVIGSDRLSTELHEINEAANKTYTNLVLDYTYNADSDPNRYYYRSDHYNFAEKGIPAIFYFNGTHVDYHRPSDTVEKIHFEKMAKIGQLVFYTTWELANRDKRIEVNVKGRN